MYRKKNKRKKEDNNKISKKIVYLNILPSYQNLFRIRTNYFYLYKNKILCSPRNHLQTHRQINSKR